MPASDRYGGGGGFGGGNGYGNGGYDGNDGGDPSSPRNGASPEAANAASVVPPPHADIFASAMAAAAAEHDSVSVHSSASSETYGSQKSGYSGDSQTPISINHIKGTVINDVCKNV